jgi:hypothetical protein
VVDLVERVLQDLQVKTQTLETLLLMAYKSLVQEMHLAMDLVLEL